MTHFDVKKTGKMTILLGKITPFSLILGVKSVS